MIFQSVCSRTHLPSFHTMQGNAYTPDVPDVCETIFSWKYVSHDNDLTTCTQVIRQSHDFNVMTVLTTDQLTTLVGYIGHCIFWTPDWTNQLNNLPWRSYWDSNMCVFMHVGHICWPFWSCDNHCPVYINKVTTSMQWVEAAEAKKWFTAHYLVTVVTTHTGCLALCGNLNNNDWFGVSALQRVQSPTRVV